MRKYYLLTPFVFTASSIIYIYLITSGYTAPVQLVRSLLVLWGVLAFLTFPVYWFLKDWQWTSLFLSVIALSIFTTPLLFQIEVILVAAVVFLWSVSFYILNMKMSIYQFQNILSLTSTFVLMAILWVALREASTVSLTELPQITWENNKRPILLSSQNNRPDIYFIVLDGYARNDVLNEHFDFDNSEFLGELQARDFLLPTDARSNYHKTVLSISSALNMNYVSELLPELDEKDTYYWWLMEPLIDNSIVRASLEKQGYRSYAIETGWGLTDNPTTDVYFQPCSIAINDYENILIKKTPINMLSRFFSQLSCFPSHDNHRRIVNFNFEKLSEISKETGPKFVFAHILSPHPPFVFGENGEHLMPSYNYSLRDANEILITDDEYRYFYVNQMKFVNTMLVDLVDEILANSSSPPIIILQADHGSGMLTDFRSSMNTCLKERFSVFAAYYFPNIAQESMPVDMTPVNLFRFVFNEYFGTELPVLPNRHYYFKESVYLFQTEDVTLSVDSCSASE